jgi:hypothetical protein
VPKFMEDKLKSEYPGDKAAPFKIMNKLGMMHGSKETPLGAAAQKKHEAKKTSGLAKMGKKDSDGDYD